jgi:hypothetical protein
MAGKFASSADTAMRERNRLPARLEPMTDNTTPFTTPFADIGLERAIALRWTLRDIKAERLRLSPASPDDLTALTELGLIEIRDNAPVLTEAGHDVLD